MTVEWILNRLFNPPPNEGGRYNSSTNNNFHKNQNPTNNMNPTIRSILTGPIYPIITSNSINNQQNIPNNLNTNDNRLQPDHPDYGTIYNNNNKDGFQRDLNLPIFSPNYPAFFVLVLLVTLTSFALFVLLFLCCLDVSGKDTENRKEEVSLPDEPEPPFKEVGVGTEPEITQVEHLVEMENEVIENCHNDVETIENAGVSEFVSECRTVNEMGIMEIQIEEPLTLKQILKSTKVK